MADEMNEEPKGVAPAKPFRSHAIWPPDCCPAIGNVSQDDHYTREEAEGVCNLLRRNGFGGDGKFFPVSVWVEELTPPEQPLCVCGHEKASHRFGPHKQECGENLGKDMCTCWSFRPAQPAQEEGTDVPDGCDHEGFQGGCVRFGHTPETCPSAPAQAMSAEERAKVQALEFRDFYGCKWAKDSPAQAYLENLITAALAAHAAAEVARVEGLLKRMECGHRVACRVEGDGYSWPCGICERNEALAELAQLRETLANAKRELSEIANMCDAPHWTTDRRYRIRDKARNASK